MAGITRRSTPERREDSRNPQQERSERMLWKVRTLATDRRGLAPDRHVAQNRASFPFICPETLKTGKVGGNR
jgi:hypothetical protein